MRKRLVLLPAFLLLFGTQSSLADDFTVTPNAALRSEYNDNIIFNDTNEEDDFITTASLGIDVVERTEKFLAAFKGRLDGLSYADHDEFNDIEEYYNGRLRFNFAPYLKVSADAGYSVDSRPDRDIDVTGFVLGAEARRQQKYSLSTEYQISEKNAFTASYSYQDDQFETSDTNEFTGHNVFAAYSRSLDFVRPTSARLYAHYSHYDFFSSKVENYKVTAGFSRRVNEKLQYVVDIGPRYTEGREKRTGETSYDKGLGGQFVLTYDAKSATAEATLFHEVSGSGGRNGATERTGLRLSLRHHFDEKSFCQVRLNTYLNKADRNAAFVADLDELTTVFTPLLHYEFNRQFACETAYRFTVIDDRELDHERHRNIVFVKLVYKHPVVE